MYKQTGWYNIGGKSVWVQKYLTYGLMYWTPETGWLELSAERMKKKLFSLHKRTGVIIMTQIFTSAELSAGRVFDFYCAEEILKLEDTIEIWAERDRNGLGDPIIYGKARVIRIPYHPAHMYKALVLSK